MTNAAQPRPGLAVVGSVVSQDEELFGKAFDRNVMLRLGVFLQPYRKRLRIAVVAVLVFTLTQLTIPLMVRYVIDGVVVGDVDARLILYIAVATFFAAIFTNFIANRIQERVVGHVAGHMLFDLRRAMYAHVQNVSLSFMDRTETGRLMSRLQGDVYALQEFLESTIFAVGDLILLVGIIVVLLSLDVRLGALTLTVVPILLGIRMVWLPRARRVFLKARETSSAVNAALAENIHGVRAIQETGREDLNLTLFGDKVAENLRAHLVASRYANIMIPVVDTLTGLALAVVIVVGGSMVAESALDLGVMVAFLFYVQRFFDPIRSLTFQYSIMQRAMAAGQRIFEVLDVEVEITDKHYALDLAGRRGSVEFQNVTFGYEPDLPVLRNVSFRVDEGETVALVGPTGSGKTSAMALAHRFYDVWDGAVRVGGVDVRDLRQEALGRHIAMVLQEPYLFSGTILENIRYNKFDADYDDVVEAARAVGADDFIRVLPDGYDTQLDQGAASLSVGQRQLLSFARALVADTRILILDEATANIDSYTELQIQRALARLLQGRTALIIAHRLATIRNADRIIVLQDGEIVETGSHAELMESGRLYSRLYRMNYASFDDISPEELAYFSSATGRAT